MRGLLGQDTDNNGKTVSLRQTLLIVTTNTLDEIPPEIANNQSLLRAEIQRRSIEKARETPGLTEVTGPFLRRANSVVYAGFLQPSDLELIMEKEIKNLLHGDKALKRAADPNLSSRMIGLEASPEAKRLIARKTFLDSQGKPNGDKISKEFPTKIKDHIDHFFNTGAPKVEKVSNNPTAVFSESADFRPLKVEDGQLLRLEARITKGTPEDPEDFELFLTVVKD